MDHAYMIPVVIHGRLIVQVVVIVVIIAMTHPKENTMILTIIWFA